MRGIAGAAMLGIVALIATGCTATGSAAAGVHEQVDTPFAKSVEDSLSQALDSAIALSASTGGVAGVWAPWAGEWTAARGKTSIEKGAALTLDTHFRIGQLTQGMTCTVLLRLVDEKKVTLDTTVAELLPSIPGTGAITLGQLCQGTSGLADTHGILAGQYAANPERPWPAIELVSNALALPRIADPGDIAAPSDAGYMLLALALEAASGRPWNDLYHDHVLSPLGLTETTIPGAATVEVPGVHPAGYLAPRAADGTVACDAVADVSRLSPSMGWTSSGAVSTVPELKTWVQALAAGSLLSDKSAKAQWSTIPIGVDVPQWQGFGLGATQIGPMRGGSASMGGYLTAAYSDPQSGLTVVVMLNNATAGPDFAKSFALELASLGARADAAAGSGSEKPVIELPWSAEQMAEALTAAAVCQPAPAP